MEATLDDVGCLIKDAKNGDEQAITRLITIHKGLVFTIVWRMTGDYHASQDLTQETFIKALSNIKKVKSGDHFKPWLCTIARNVVRDYLRKAKRTQAVSLEVIEDLHGDSNGETARRRVIIQQGLAKLSERDRMILTLAYYDGLSLGEVGKAMKMSETAVKVCVHRARKRLRKHLEGYEYELLSAC